MLGLQRWKFAVAVCSMVIKKQRINAWKVAYHLVGKISKFSGFPLGIFSSSLLGAYRCIIQSWKITHHVKSVEGPSRIKLPPWSFCVSYLLHLSSIFQTNNISPDTLAEVHEKSEIDKSYIIEPSLKRCVCEKWPVNLVKTKRFSWNPCYWLQLKFSFVVTISLVLCKKWWFSSVCYPFHAHFSAWRPTAK